jgi:hypothetical protein
MPVRDQAQSRQERRRQQRRQQLARQQRRHSTRRWSIIGGVVVLLLLIGGGGAGAYFAFAPRTGAPSPGGAIDGIACQSEMLTYHIHAHLTLYKNGKPVPVPAYVGIPYSSAIHVGGQNTCLFYLHTHDASGVIHIESPTKPERPFMLGQFFDIWHYTSLWDAQGGIAGQAGLVVDDSFVNALKAAKPRDIHVFVNGKPVSGDYRSITLTKHKLITIEIGTPLKSPTTHYDFSAVD